MIAACSESSPPSCAPSSADRLRGIKAPELAAWWPIAEPLLARAVERNPNYTLAEIRKSIATGSRQLWVREPGHEVAVVTEIAMYPAGRRLNVFAIGGELRDGWELLFRSLEEWGRGLGCKGVDIYGREGWRRKLPGYRLTRVVLSKELSHGR